ncbi:unnamed protein product, partial [Cuscuta epithymum]
MMPPSSPVVKLNAPVTCSLPPPILPRD